MPIYSDLNLTDPIKKPLVTDTESILQSIKMILNTKKGERLFNSNFGLDLEDTIFDLILPETTLEIERKIFNAIEAFEPRVILDKSKSRVTANAQQHRYDVVLVMNIKGVINGEMIRFTGSLRKE